MPGLLYLVVQLFRRHCGRVVSLVLTVARHPGGVDEESLNRGRHQHAQRLKQHPYSGKHEGCSLYWSQVCLFAWCLFVCVILCLFVCLFVCVILCLFVCFFFFVCLILCLCDSLFVCFFVCLFLWFFVCLILCLCDCLCDPCLFVWFFVCLFDSLFVWLVWLYTDRRWWFGLMLMNTRRCMEMIYGLTVGCCGVPFPLILADVHRHWGVGHVYSLIKHHIVTMLHSKHLHQ